MDFHWGCCLLLILSQYASFPARFQPGTYWHALCRMVVLVENDLHHEVELKG